MNRYALWLLAALLVGFAILWVMVAFGYGQVDSNPLAGPYSE